MGIVHLPPPFLENDEVYHYSPIAYKISCNRFHELHCSTLWTKVLCYHQVVWLGKVRPVADFLSEEIAAVYEPERDISIDKAMIPFKGQSSLKQCMPLKPVRRGIKVWARTESSSGYVYGFQVYTGKQGGTTKTGLGEKVVKTLKIWKAPIDTSSSIITSRVYTSWHASKWALWLWYTSFKPQRVPPTVEGTYEEGVQGEVRAGHDSLRTWPSRRGRTISLSSSLPGIQIRQCFL